MSIFDINNPRHKQILKEELARAKRLMEQSYNADAIWDSMTPIDRKEALYIAKEPNPEALLNVAWDDIPADTQDLIDLGNYQYARDDQGARSMLRGIQDALKQHPESESFVKKFLAKVGRSEIRDITVIQAYKLNPALRQYINSKKPATVRSTSDQSDFNPYDMPGGQTSKGYMGSTYRGD